MEDIVQKILEVGLQQSIWTALYLFLFFRQLKESKEREQKYQAMIKELSDKIGEGIARIEKGIQKLTNQE